MFGLRIFGSTRGKKGSFAICCYMAIIHSCFLVNSFHFRKLLLHTHSFHLSPPKKSANVLKSFILKKNPSIRENQWNFKHIQQFEMAILKLQGLCVRTRNHLSLIFDDGWEEVMSYCLLRYFYCLFLEMEKMYELSSDRGRSIKCMWTSKEIWRWGALTYVPVRSFLACILLSGVFSAIVHDYRLVVLIIRSWMTDRHYQLMYSTVYLCRVLRFGSWIPMRGWHLTEKYRVQLGPCVQHKSINIWKKDDTGCNEINRMYVGVPDNETADRKRNSSAWAYWCLLSGNISTAY